jgi:hypothetical protein
MELQNFNPKGNIFLKNIYISLLVSTFPHLQKKFQKITMKIDIIKTCPNFQLSPTRTVVLEPLKAWDSHMWDLVILGRLM